MHALPYGLDYRRFLRSRELGDATPSSRSAGISDVRGAKSIRRTFLENDAPDRNESPRFVGFDPKQPPTSVSVVPFGGTVIVSDWFPGPFRFRSGGPKSCVDVSRRSVSFENVDWKSRRSVSTAIPNAFGTETIIVIRLANRRGFVVSRSRTIPALGSLRCIV